MSRFTLALFLALFTAALPLQAQGLQGKVEGKTYVSPTGLFQVQIPVYPELGGDITEDDLLFHDEKQAEPSLAYLLSRMHYPQFPEPMGVFRCVERPTYEDMMLRQIRDAIATKGPGKLEDLYDDGETWVVN